MGRAVADAQRLTPQFQDPTAVTLLSDEAQQRVRHFLAGDAPQGFRATLRYRHLERLSKLMAARSVAIDELLRRVPTRQVVILGAGLDGRAWRMPELRDATVFEVDHPDSQREKRARVGTLTQAAREVRFVAVDFARDDLDAALGNAGHDPSAPTIWIWEGVVMYLELQDIEATLRVIERRSAPQSHLCIVYHSPAPMLWLVGMVLRRMGEPLRSSFTAQAMQTLLARYGFHVERDENVHDVGARLSGELGKALAPIRHLRIVTAQRSRR